MKRGGPSLLAWAEIDLGAIAHNVLQLRRITQPAAVLMTAVKADGYGHGAVPTAKTALRYGAGFLGVANVDEAVALRENGINAPILIFGYTFPERIGTLLQYDLIQSVYSFEMARHFSQAAISCGGKIKIHIKLDTGMGRVGILSLPEGRCDDGRYYRSVLNEIVSIVSLKGCAVEGVFTHFATADHWDKSYAEQQFGWFMNVVNGMQAEGIRPPILHAANSAATMDMPNTHLDMVRPGIAVYGLYPSEHVTGNIVLKPALTLKTRVIQVKDVFAGFSVSYGCTYKTPHPTKIATVPIGYADGFGRVLSSYGHMMVNGQRAPVVGRVCMDMTMLDVGHIPDVAVEDEVVVIGSQGSGNVAAEEIAAKLGTISYEVVTSIGRRVRRVYKDQ
ncbi:MAG: alanine racemase [Desulfobacterales bacterium]